MASRRSIITGRTCARIGHSFPTDLLVCRRCHRDLPAIKRGDSTIFRFARRKTGPWSLRLFLERRKPKVPKQAALCHGCAFRPGSPERRDTWGIWEAVLGNVARHVPFFCHEGMPVDAKGCYAPQRGAYGHPVGAKLCAGWLTEHRLYHRPGHGLHSKAVLPTDREHEISHPAVRP